MGIYDRDYYRDDSSNKGFFVGSGSACRALIIATIIVFVGQVLTRFTPASFSRWLAMDETFLSGQVWRVVTYMFCHDVDWIWHILWNMYFLWMLGSDVETIYGKREFAKFYITAGAFAALFFALFEIMNSSLRTGIQIHPMLGASGAVSAVLVVAAMFYPTRTILLFMFIPVQLRWLVWINLIFDLHPLLLQLGSPDFAGTGVAHAAHLGGMLYGFLYKHYDLRWERLTANWSFRRLRQNLRVNRPAVKIYAPPPDDETVDQRVDELLGKIHAQGEASLSNEEREFLKEASRRYKRRQ